MFTCTSTLINLETPRLILRKFSPDDLERIVELANDVGFMRFSSGVRDQAQAAAMLERFLAPAREGKPSPFAVIVREDGALIGYCGFLLQTVDGVQEVEIGYRLDPAYWGRGLATEAARAVRDHGFRDWKMERVISLIHPDNTPSSRVAEKNGMRLEKVTTFLESPAQVYAITRAEWLERERARAAE